MKVLQFDSVISTVNIPEDCSASWLEGDLLFWSEIEEDFDFLWFNGSFKLDPKLELPVITAATSIGESVISLLRSPVFILLMFTLPFVISASSWLFFSSKIFLSLLIFSRFFFIFNAWDDIFSSLLSSMCYSSFRWRIIISCCVYLHAEEPSAVTIKPALDKTLKQQLQNLLLPPNLTTIAFQNALSPINSSQ